MIKLLIGLLSAGSMSMPAQGSVLLPSIFAAEFCSLRERGLGYEQALRVAAQGARVEGKSSKVVFHGVMIDADILKSLEAIEVACPEQMDGVYFIGEGVK